MSRKPRRKLPAPIGYTTVGGAIERDLFLIRTCRDLSPNTSYYTQLEARRFDAELVHASEAAREATRIALQRLSALGLAVNPVGEAGVVLHRANRDELPPRLRIELEEWTPASGAAPAHGTRDSVVPWMLLARMQPTRPATRTQAAPLQLYRETHLRSKDVLRDRVRPRYTRPTTSNVARVCSHIAELGQARYRRYSRYDSQLYTDTRADLRLPESLVGVRMPGIAQVLARGTVSVDLEWQNNQQAALFVHITPKGSGESVRYEIGLSATELTVLSAPVGEPGAGPRAPSADAPSDQEWVDAEQSSLDF